MISNLPHEINQLWNGFWRLIVYFIFTWLDRHDSTLTFAHRFKVFSLLKSDWEESKSRKGLSFCTEVKSMGNWWSETKNNIMVFLKQIKMNTTYPRTFERIGGSQPLLATCKPPLLVFLKRKKGQKIFLLSRRMLWFYNFFTGSGWSGMWQHNSNKFQYQIVVDVYIFLPY